MIVGLVHGGQHPEQPLFQRQTLEREFQHARGDPVRQDRRVATGFRNHLQAFALDQDQQIGPVGLEDGLEFGCGVKEGHGVRRVHSPVERAMGEVTDSDTPLSQGRSQLVGSQSVAHRGSLGIRQIAMDVDEDLLRHAGDHPSK